MDIKRPGTPYAHITVEQAELHDAMPAKPCLSHKELRLQRRTARLPIQRSETAATAIDRGWVRFPHILESPPPEAPSLWRRCLAYLGL